MLPPVDVQAQVTRLIREDWGRILSALVSSIGDYALAEDSLQDAVIKALEVWPEKGAPRHPDAWMISVAKRKALDRLRRSATATRKEAELTLWLEQHQSDPEDTPMLITDHRLELIYTCCHPALEEKSRVALTLRALGGLTTAEIARAFLDKTDAMAARLTRAKKKLAGAGIPFKLPEPEDLHDRTDAVLRVVYLIFNEGYQASDGQLTRGDLVAEAIRLGRILTGLLPDHAEAHGLLALMLLGESRRLARQGQGGAFIPLELQNRARWDRAKIAEGLELVETTLSMGRAGPYALQAAISAVHAQADDFASTDWAQIVALYDVLYARQPNPVLKINQAVALSYADSPQAGLALLNSVEAEGKFARYQPFHACRADLLARLGRDHDAAESYRTAIALSDVPAQAAFLESRLHALNAP
ncbi:RNA polymerase sigma factor [Aliiroseovarius marinus]|uniref:RNA polymerase sigma factor n=1 Tax=Aliiroseovarius marinus TaxID=2500159 RepID=UPI00105B6FA7|nr:sigma-70 family RNA polymerase sigma factor [Aliiroseovarius marinus]